MFVLLCPQEHFNHHVGLVHGDSSGAGGSSCCGHGGHSSRLPPCRGGGSGCWGTLWGPLTLSCPEEASASKPAQEGFLFLWAVLSCLSGTGVLSCHVLFCVSSPGGLLIPPDFPREIFRGCKRGSGCRGRAEGTEAMASRAPSSAMASRAPSSTMASWAPCTAMASRAPSSAMVPVSLFHSGGPHPVFLSVFVLRSLQSAHPPSPMELLRLGTSLSGGGSYVRVLLCVSCVPASCVHIWFVSCPCFMSLWVKYVPAVFVSLCVNYPVYISPVFWVWFRLVYSLFPGVSVHVSPALMSTLKTIIWVYVLACVSLFLPRVCTVTSIIFVQN